MHHTDDRPYQICQRCIMDTSDPENTFNTDGICLRCREYELRLQASPICDPQREEKLERLVETIRHEGQGKDYDCIIGVSGGTDSTYATYITRKLGLRPLAIHLDNGWNSELAVSNIENTLKALDIDLYTHVLDWDEFRDLQLAFLRSSTPDSEIPTDHAIFSLLRIKANELGIRHIITGINTRTEGITVPAWSRGHTDWKYIQSIHQRFGTVPLKTFPHCSWLDYAYYRDIKRQQRIRILDYVEYNKKEAVQTITDELNWRPYLGKHHESIYTRFYQIYILPKKFGFDKRRWHLSDLIMAGQITRDEALAEMEEDIYPVDLVQQDKIFVAKKLGISEQEFDAVIAESPKTFFDYPSYESTPYVRFLRAIKSKFMSPGTVLATTRPID